MTPELYSQIRRINFKMEKLVTDLLAGAYRSRFKGRGMEFEEVREYNQGDEVRTIDWNVTARMNAPYVKRFREERELTVILLVDISLSAYFGRDKTKRQAMAEVGALLAFAAIKNNDKIGLILFSDRIEKYVPPAKGSKHVQRLIRELVAANPQGKKTDIKQALKFLNQVQTKPAVVFLLSDFLSPTYEKDLKISEKAHDLIAIRVLDPLEITLKQEALKPFSLIEFSDLESGENRMIDTSSKPVQAYFEGERKKLDESFFSQMGKAGVPVIDLKSNEPFDRPLEKFFKTGKKR
ncbi:MAG: DUF58 domain-containing protein [Parachlamydiaceae bacterium]